MLNATLIFVTFIGLIVLGMPISMSIGIGTVVAAILGDFSISSIPLMITSGSSNFSLVAIPYFIFLGNVMNMGGITDRMFEWAEACIGHIRGGLAQVNVLASVIFAGVSGTSSADAAGLGLVEIRAMEKKGYDLPFSVAITMVSSILGPIIPPSVSLLVFASLTGTSVAKLFAAGVIPGVVVAIGMMLINTRLCKEGKVIVPEPEPFSPKRFWIATKHGILALLCPVILLITMLSGAITPTEAGIIGSLYSLLVAAVYGELSAKKLWQACVETVNSCALIMFLIGMGNALAWFLTAEQIPQAVSTFLFGLTSNKYVILIIINIILLILGMFMDATAIQLIMVPILLPVIKTIGMSMIQFGLMVTVNILIGTMTPPYGLGLFIMSSVSKLSIPQILKATKPFFPIVIAFLLLITYVPWFSEFLPNLLFGA